MKLKNMWKRFWTLDVHNHEGFTLVELIIVIAILAILSTGAIAGYSAYVEKANITADKALISEVANALLLHYYNNGGNEGGFVVITHDGIETPANFEQANAFAAEAMKIAYGDNWRKVLSLKHEWNTNLAGSSAATIAPGKLTGTVSSLTGLASAVVGGQGDNKNATNIISVLTSDNAELKAELQKYENDEDYATIASNLLVNFVSGELKGMNAPENQDKEISWVSTTALQYAMIYSMANSNDANSAEAQKRLEAFDKTLAEIAEKEKTDATGTSVKLEIGNALDDLLFADSDLTDAEGQPITFEDAFNQYFESNAGTTDFEGVLNAMGFVNSVSNGYTDRDSLANSNLYNSDDVVGMLTDYQNASQYGVVVRISKDGVITVLPTEAYGA